MIGKPAAEDNPATRGARAAKIALHIQLPVANGSGDAMQGCARGGAPTCKVAMTSGPTDTAGLFGRVLVVGGSGRLGGLLHLAWARVGQSGLLWQSRSGAAAAGLRFDPLDEPEAFARAARDMDAILNLAGVTGGDAAALARNRALALAALGAGRAAGVSRVFLASSAAVYGRAEGAAREDGPVRPLSAYGRAKREMEMAALDLAGRGGGPAVTCLRIGNVAGADQLLGAAPGPGPQLLDVFEGGHGPARSYVGPQALAAMLGGLFAASHAGGDIPPVLNLALAGAVRMEALLEADGRPWRPRPAPEGLVEEVRLDTALLGRTIGKPALADAAGIVADLREILPRGAAADPDRGAS